MATDPMRREIKIMRQSFFDEGILDDERLSYLETLETEDDPDFIEDLFRVFLKDSTTYIAKIERGLENNPGNPPFLLEGSMYRLKGSSASIGATKIKTETTKLKKFCDEGDMESAKAIFQQLKAEHDNFKNKLGAYVELINQAKLAGQYYEQEDDPLCKAENH